MKSQLTIDIRENLVTNAKTFKTSWIFLGQTLYTVFRDKLFHEWGFEKFEDYTSQELGMKKSLAMKLVKTYFFVEQQEPNYLREEFSQDKEAAIIPSYEPLDLLRLAHRSSIGREDYAKIRKDVFAGKDTSLIKKDLTQIMKERKQVNPDEEREKRNKSAIKKFMQSIRIFNGEMEILKLIESHIVESSETLLRKLEEKYS